MGNVVIKLDRDRDEYVLWSTETESPIAYGTRTEMLDHLGGDLQPGTCPTCQQYVSHQSIPTARLARADVKGSSDMSHGWGWWDYDEFLYAQQGTLARSDLARACALLCDGREADVAALLTPFDED